MIDLHSVKILNDQIKTLDLTATGRDEVLQNLSVLYTTPVGTVPFDRNFGVDFGIVDSPIDRAKGRITVDYIEKTKRYEPRASVREVNFESDAITGFLIPRVVIDIDLEAE